MRFIQTLHFVFIKKANTGDIMLILRLIRRPPDADIPLQF